MKRTLASQIRQIAAQLPEKWKKDYETIQMSGAEANLCTTGKPYPDDRVIEFKSPVFTQINHYRELKEGVKKHGLPFVGQYISRF